MSFPRPYGRYVLEERIAMGGMAEIFRAHTSQEGFEKPVCIKRVLPHFLEDDSFVAMFRDEAMLAARLQHANIVQVFDFGEVEGTLYLAMELVDGADLRKLVQRAKARGERLGVGEAVQIVVEIARGLHHAHVLADRGQRMSIVHRDVSPHNVLVSRAGEVKITDFGIAKAAQRSSQTSTGIVKGKIAYMSPEQANGERVDHRTDQFATGVILWELLTGERLFTGENDAAILARVLACDVRAPSTLRPGIPAELDEIALRALGRLPAQRFADMREMEGALMRLLYSGALDATAIDVGGLAKRLLDEEGKRKTAQLPAPRLDDDPSPSALAAMDTRRSAPPDVASTSQEIGDDVFTTSDKQRPAPGPPPSTAREPIADLSGTPVLPHPFEQTSATATFAPPQCSSETPLVATVMEPSPLAEEKAAARAPLFAAGVVVALAVLAAAAIVVARPPPPSPSPAPAAPIAVAPPPAAAPPVEEPAPPVAAPAPPVEAATPPVEAPAPPAEEPAPAAKKKATGALLVDVIDGWAEVYEGARKLGDTPATLSLPAGPHKLRLVNPETKASRTFDVVVPPAGRAVLRERL